MTLAVIKTGGKQYLVSEGDVLEVEKLEGTDGKISFAEVLLVANDSSVKVGAPLVEGAAVEAELVREFRDDKVKVYKMHRRKRYHRTQGHRQTKTQIKITKISV